MALTVEDGTGLADADALISLAYADSYHSDRGNSTWTGTDADKEAAIRRASFFLTNSFNWEGYRLNGRSQSLAWPRTYVTDYEGNSVPSDEVPTEVQQACAEAALRELVDAGSLTPDYTPSERVKSEKFGPVAFEYDMSQPSAEASRPIMLIVRDLIGQFLANDGGSQIFGRVSRG